MNETKSNFFKPAKEVHKPDTEKANPLAKSQDSRFKKTSLNRIKFNKTKQSNVNLLSQINTSTEELYATKSQKMSLNAIFDPEYLYKENINLKNLLNKKNNVINELKFNYLKINELNNRNMKEFEDIIVKNNTKNDSKRATFNQDTSINLNTSGELQEENKENRAITDGNELNKSQVKINDATFVLDGKLDDKSLVKLREMSMLNSLKKQLYTFKRQLKEKDEEIENLKTSSKCVRYAELETEYHKRFQELNQLKIQHEQIKLALADKEKKLKVVSEEKDNTKAMLTKVKERFEENHAHLNTYQEENMNLKNKITVLEEKLKGMDFKLTNSKNVIKDKEKELEEYKSDVVLVEHYRKERPEIEKKLENLQGKVRILKHENEKKSSRLTEVEHNLSTLQVDSDQKIKSLNKKIKVLEEKMGGFKGEKDELNKKIDDLKAKNADLEKTVEELNGDIQKNKENLSEEENKNTSNYSKISSLEREIGQLKEQINNLTEEKKNLEEENKTLKEEKKTLEEEKKKLEQGATQAEQAA